MLQHRLCLKVKDLHFNICNRLSVHSYFYVDKAEEEELWSKTNFCVSSETRENYPTSHDEKHITTKTEQNKFTQKRWEREKK
jgi:hypothetical protein